MISASGGSPTVNRRVQPEDYTEGASAKGKKYWAMGTRRSTSAGASAKEWRRTSPGGSPPDIVAPHGARASGLHPPARAAHRPAPLSALERGAGQGRRP